MRAAPRPAERARDARPSSRAARSPRSTPPAPSTPTGTSSSTGDRIVAVGAGPRPAPDARRRAHRRPRAAWPRPGSSTATTTSTSGPPAAWPSRRRCSSGSSRSTRSGRTSTTRSSRPRPAPGSPRSRARAARPSTDHHYVFPARRRRPARGRDRGGARLGLRFHPCRGSMDLGRSDGGLPPDEVVEDRDAILAASEAAIDRFHDPAPGRDGADRARAVLAVLGHARADGRDGRARPPARRAAAHPPGRDARRGGASASSASACARSSTSSDLGWLGDDVWLAHCVHLDDAEIGALRRDRHRRRALPDLQRAARRRHRAGRRPACAPARRSASGVDGAASNEAGELAVELRQALLVARLARRPGGA